MTSDTTSIRFFGISVFLLRWIVSVHSAALFPSMASPSSLLHIPCILLRTQFFIDDACVFFLAHQNCLAATLFSPILFLLFSHSRMFRHQRTARQPTRKQKACVVSATSIACLSSHFPLVCNSHQSIDMSFFFLVCTGGIETRRGKSYEKLSPEMIWWGFWV